MTPRKFTATEWRDLARGCRALADRDAAAMEKHGRTSVASQFERSQALHLEMALICEQWAELTPPDQTEAPKPWR